MLPDRELSTVPVSEVDDDEDDLSAQLVRLKDGPHEIVLPYSWTCSSRQAIKIMKK